jgi:hypothetical protein
MKFNIRKYSKELEDNNIHLIYNGPIWADGIDGISEMLLKRLELDDMPLSASQSVFSIFVEQANNMLMYSVDKKGIFIVGLQDRMYFIQSGSVASDSGAEILKSRIDYLNSLNKNELREYYKQQMQASTENTHSKGAGLGLMEIARRAAGPIEYSFERHSDGLQYFSSYVTVKQ